MTLSSLKKAGEAGTVTRTLTAEPAAAEALAPFGTLIGGAPDETARLSNFYDQAVLVQKSAFQSALPVEISLCTIEPRGFTVRWLERPFQHTQALPFLFESLTLDRCELPVRISIGLHCLSERNGRRRFAA